MNYNCPLCGGELREQIGNVLHPGDPKFGVNLSCPHVACPAQEVVGHGATAKEAWAVIQEKYIPRKERS